MEVELALVLQILVKTWSGVVIQGLGLVASARKSEVEQKRGRHFRNKLSVLPPLKSLPPPISLSDPVSSNIDLRVNFESEIKPFLGHCLVSLFSADCTSEVVFQMHVMSSRS